MTSESWIHKVNRPLEVVATAAPDDRRGAPGNQPRKRGKNKRKKNHGGGQPEQPRPQQGTTEQTPQQRSIESALGSYAAQMRHALRSSFSREKGVFQIQYRIEPTIKSGGTSAELLLDIAKITCKQDADVPLLVQQFLERLNDEIQKRPGEDVKLFTETEKIKVERIEPGNEPRYQSVEHAIELESKTAGGERTPAWLARRLREMYGKVRKQERGEAVVADPELKRMASERYALRRANAQLKGQVEAAQRESALRQSEIDARKREITELRSRIGGLQGNLQAREAAHTELERQLAALDNEKKNIVAQSEAARADEARKRATLDAAILRHKGDYEKLLAQYQKAHATVDATERKLQENEADRRRLTERLSAALALEESTRENIVRLEADLVEKSRMAELAVINEAKFKRQSAEVERLQRVNEEQAARLHLLETRGGADKGAYDRSLTQIAEQNTEIEQLRALYAASEKAGSGMRVVLDRFAEILRALATDESANTESRDGALMTLQFLNAVTQDQASASPEEMRATNAVLDRFKRIIEGKSE